MLGDIGISNGLAWSLDGSLMYYIDTSTSAVRAFDFDMASGAINNSKIIIEVPKSMGFPDGMTMMPWGSGLPVWRVKERL